MNDPHHKMHVNFKERLKIRVWSEYCMWFLMVLLKSDFIRALLVYLDITFVTMSVDGV